MLGTSEQTGKTSKICFIKIGHTAASKPKWVGFSSKKNWFWHIWKLEKKIFISLLGLFSPKPPLKSNLITSIVSNIESRFKNLKTWEEFDRFKLLKKVKWCYRHNTELLTEFDHNHVNVISVWFNSVLSHHKLDAKEAQKGYKKVTYCFCFVFLCLVCIKSDQSNCCMNGKDS